MNNAWIELDLDALDGNIRTLRKSIEGNSEIIFVVKADAYGHGMEIVARRAWQQGIKYFTVAHMDEAVQLRDVLSEAEIIIVGVISEDDVATAIKKNLVPVIVSQKHARSLAKAAAALKPPRALRVHAKIDTGMGRLGFMWEEALAVLREIKQEKGLDICGLCTHFASADSDDKTFANIQAKRFESVAEGCAEEGMTPCFKHIANSGALQNEPTWDMDGVRPGIILYGYGSVSQSKRDIVTRPFLSWKSRVVQVRKVPSGFPVGYDSTYLTNNETYLATIDVGYADGYPRNLSNKGQVIIGGKRRAIAGRVTMNLISVELGDDDSVSEGDEVVLIGSQGDESIWAEELAELSDTIAYEILTNIKVPAGETE